jgi:DNA-binding transcriptional ArsR family regulator
MDSKLHQNRRPATEAEAKALASTVRLRIIRLCLDRPLTNKEIAARLEANPATTLHHVRTLVSTGFLAPQEERRGNRNSREVPYLSTGKSWTLNVRDSGVTGGQQAMVGAFLEELSLLDMDSEQINMARLGLRLTDEEHNELNLRLATLLAEYADRPPSANGQAYSVFVVLHPDVSRDV